MSEPTLPCPQCNAPMRIDVEKGEARCAQCGAVRKVEPVGEGQEERNERRSREALGMPPYALWLLLGGVAIAALMFPVLSWYEKRILPPGTEAKRELAAPPPAEIVWDVTRPPLFRDLNGDGIDDLIGRYRPDEKGASTDTMHVGAFDGRTLRSIWTTESLGEWADSLGTVQLALTGNALLLTDSHGGVQLRDASNGAVGKQFAVAGTAQQVCADPSGVVRFWVSVQGGPSVYVEDTVPQPTPAPRPSWCPPPAALGTSSPRAHLLGNANAPQVTGFAPALVLNEGTDAVAVGLESGLPMLVGFDPSRPGVRWKHPVTLESEEVRKEAPLGADMANGVVYVPYQVGSGRRLAALEVLSGKPRWDVPIPGQGTGTAPWERIIPRDMRVYVPGPLGLVALDTQTGKRVGTLGK